MFSFCSFVQHYWQCSGYESNHLQVQEMHRDQRTAQNMKEGKWNSSFHLIQKPFPPNDLRFLEAGYINQFPPCVRATLLCSSFKTGSTCHVPKEKRVHLTWSQKPVRNTNLCFAFSCWYYKYRFWLHSFEGVIHIIELRDCFAVHRISSKIIELCNFSLTKVVPDKLSTSVDRKTFLLLLHIPSEIKVVWSSTKNVIIQPRQHIFADGVQSDMLRYIKEKSGGIVVAKDAVTSLVTVWDG